MRFSLFISAALLLATAAFGETPVVTTIPPSPQQPPNLVGVSNGNDIILVEKGDFQRFLRKHSVNGVHDPDAKCPLSLKVGGLSASWGWNFGREAYKDAVSYVNELAIDKLLAVQYETRTGQAISFGVGLLWRQYHLKSGYSYVKLPVDGSVAVFPADPSHQHRHSSLTVFSWELPLIFKQKMGDLWSLFVGPALNLNSYATFCNSYRDDDTSVKTTVKKLRQRVATVDVLFGINYRSIGVIARYNPMGAFKAIDGPRSSTFTLGLTLGM